MSHKTRHELFCVQGNVETSDITRFLEERNGRYRDVDTGWHEVINRYPVDWKDRDEHLKAVSQNWPQAVFALNLQGEDGLDVTREYHHNGRSYTVELEMPPFDPGWLDGQAPATTAAAAAAAAAAPAPAQEDRWDPDASIYPGMRAQHLLNEALWDLNEGAGGNYPDGEELDGLAPSIRELVMREIRLSNLQPCRHDYDGLADMSHDVIAKLPEVELTALKDVINSPVGVNPETG